MPQKDDFGRYLQTVSLNRHLARSQSEQQPLRLEKQIAKNPMSTRLLFISKELSSDTHSCNIINAPETDHSAITLHLKTEDLLQPRAPGFWKFNNSLLDDEDFTSAIRESLPDFKDKYTDLGDLGLK